MFETQHIHVAHANDDLANLLVTIDDAEANHEVEASTNLALCRRLLKIDSIYSVARNECFAVTHEACHFTPLVSSPQRKCICVVNRGWLCREIGQDTIDRCLRRCVGKGLKFLFEGG
jgi:hypothetical protein